MPPTLDLSRTSHKMIVSPPRINLRRAASYTHDRGPLSSTSSRFGFDHLLFASPPPSPGLPQLLPRKRKVSHTPRPSRVIRLVVSLAGLVSGLYLLYLALLGDAKPVRPLRDGLYIWPTEPGAIRNAEDSESAYDMVAQTFLPGHPTPVIVSDQHGNPKWTVSIPPNSNFPLAAQEYSSICAKCVEVANRVDALRGHGSGIHSIGLGGISRKRKPKTAAERLHAFDGDFVDVHEAEVAGFLTGSVSIGTLLNQHANDNDNDGNIVGESASSLAGKPVCGRSLTFVLASSDAGLGHTLMLLWMAYAQAQAEHRGFFIDDTRWAYGRYAHIFAPPPPPDCRPPLRHEMLPCPRQARHLVLTIDTASQFFFPADKGDAADSTAPDRSARLFDLARKGYEALFHLNDDDAQHVAQRVQQLRAQTAPAADAAVSDKDEHGPAGSIVGMHVRHGDRRPVEYQYRDSYLPLNLYADRAATAAAELAARHKKEASKHGRGSSLLVVASDDPMVYEAEELAGAARAQEHIRLASKAAPAPVEANRGAFRKFVDETFGWEGGFFAAMFWNLGGGSDAQSASAETLRVRSLVGRAYMMDLAVLAQASDSVVCAVSATGCRLLAVMMGRHAALEQGRWINIDGEYGWWPA